MKLEKSTIKKIAQPGSLRAVVTSLQSMEILLNQLYNKKLFLLPRRKRKNTLQKYLKLKQNIINEEQLKEY